MKKIFRFISIMFCIVCVISFCACSLGNKSTFVYQGENGAYATLTVDFDNETYTYEGCDFYSKSAGLGMRPGTSYSVSSSIYLVKEVNGEKYYTFHDHPWEHTYYFILSEDGQSIRSGLAGYFVFVKQ